MPSKSKKQQKFFQLVRGVQTGKVSKSKVSEHLKDAAKHITPKAAHEFAVKVKKDEEDSEFVSKSQRKFMFLKHPKIAKKIAKETPKGKKLPEHVAKGDEDCEFEVKPFFKRFEESLEE